MILEIGSGAFGLMLYGPYRMESMVVQDGG